MAGSTATAGQAVDNAPLRSLEDELIALIAGNAVRTQPTVITGALMVVLMLALYVPVIYPLIWFAALLVAIWFRTRLLVALDRGTSASPRNRVTQAAAAYLLTGTVQGMVMCFLPHVPVSIGALVTCYMVSLCAGMIGGTAGCQRVVLWYTSVVMGSVMAAWLVTADPDRGLLVRAGFTGMVLVYVLAILDYARRTYAVFCESYNIRQQRIELNEQLRDALGQAEAANRAKTRFLASASHDLRQPIHALSLFSGSLLLRDLDPRSALIADQIDKAVRVLGSQLDALLDVSRLDAGVIQRSISSVDLRAALAQLREEFVLQAERRGLRLDVDAAEPFYVLTDPVLLHRVLSNLISNAIKYTVSGSVEVRAVRSGTGCRLTVRDTGPGIPSAECERVFEEFYQLENPERDRAKGLGLGLAIVRRLTELLEVPLHMTSQVGEGTEFEILLPLAPAIEAPAPEPDPLPEDEPPPLQVLVIDDEEAIRLGMKTLLEEMGFGVHVAASTAEALGARAQFHPAILLADFRLRGDDTGILAIQTLRRIWPGLPALLISGDIAPDRLREARDAGVELLHKPVSADALRQSILKAIAA